MGDARRIECDASGCGQSQPFARDAPPPVSWLILKHPVIAKTPGMVRLARDESTFCSYACLANWAADYKET
jgi:hypothetical protein